MNEWRAELKDSDFHSPVANTQEHFPMEFMRSI